MDKELLKMNLQFFAEPGDNPDDNPGDGEPPADDKKPVDTISKEDAEKLIAQNKSKAKEEARKELESEYNEKLRNAVQEAVKKSKLSEDELETYEQAEERRKLQKERDDLASTKESLQQRVNELEAQINKQSLQENATKTLTEKGIAPSERNLKLVLRGAETADDVLEAIDLLADTLSEEKNVLAQSQPPKSSGGFQNKKQDSVTSILDNAKITKF